MGINIEYLSFFDICYEKKSLYGDMAVLGSQEMHDPKEVLVRFAQNNNYPEFEKDPSVRNLFKERYGISRYVDYDMNDSADIKLDLSVPVSRSLYNSCDIVLNAGTAEHIFNIATVFKNMHKMVRPGGVFVNIVPYTWCNHGFLILIREFFIV